MAVQQNKVSRARRDKRRTHDGHRAATLATDPTSGEVHLRHRITADGFYRGRQVVGHEQFDDED